MPGAVQNETPTDAPFEVALASPREGPTKGHWHALAIHRTTSRILTNVYACIVYEMGSLQFNDVFHIFSLVTCSLRHALNLGSGRWKALGQ